MRILLTALITLALLASEALAQTDPGAQAAQQAAEQAIQANQQAIQAMQQASQQAAQQAMQASQPTTPFWPGCCALAAKPKFSVKPGTYSTPRTVKIIDSTRGAIIYYTTDGWTPTQDSPRYMGPITVDSTTTLQAIAVVPYYRRSFVAKAEYKFPAPAPVPARASEVPSAPSNASVTPSPNKLVLVQNTPVHLAFAADVSSKTASVGDKIPLTLAEDLMIDDVVLVKQGTPAAGRIIQVDKTGLGGQPGDLTFQADSLDVNGTSVKLRGTVFLEGEAKPPNAEVLIPVVGGAFLLKHGQDAEIKKGATLTAYVDGDTSLPPAQ
ncbi:MAG: chitobiase/beta-hexosaminidase C-terminal domain-containing protein [Candidatus Acidiferrum sp.]|jgi:type II secretory pathway pseudopilin PulG